MSPVEFKKMRVALSNLRVKGSASSLRTLPEEGHSRVLSAGSELGAKQVRWMLPSHLTQAVMAGHCQGPFPDVSFYRSLRGTWSSGQGGRIACQPRGDCSEKEALTKNVLNPTTPPAAIYPYVWGP